MPTGNNEQTLTNLPVVEPDGHVVLVGTYYQNQAFNVNGGKFFITRSSDGGATWSPVRFPFNLKPVGIPGIRGGDGVPNATVDRRTGKLYAVWQDSRFSGKKRDDILLTSSSRTRVRTWSAPVKVNDTPAGAQGAFTPTVKVDADGRVGVLYYDLRDDATPQGRHLHDDRVDRVSRPTAATRSGRAERVAPDFDHAFAANAGGFFLGDYQGLGVTGDTFLPFFGATLEHAGGRHDRVGHLLRGGKVGGSGEALAANDGEGLVALALHQVRSSASRLSRRSGSVLDGRTFRCQSFAVTEMPSRWEISPSSAKCSFSSCSLRATSGTGVLISPVMK